MGNADLPILSDEGSQSYEEAPTCFYLQVIIIRDTAWRGYNKTKKSVKVKTFADFFTF